jgi:hypothetical protein
MTASAREVIRFAWESYSRGIIVTPMAYQAWQPRMKLVAMRKPGVVLILRRHRVDRFSFRKRDA